jgi:formate-dependent nitrite reductase membrane component NrfD
MDPQVNGQLQKDWGWLIAIYLFLGGVGAGAYTIAAINGFMGEGAEAITSVGLWIGFPALLIGTLFLLADLGSPGRAFLAGMKPGSSWIARGTWIISIFMVLSLVHAVLYHFTDATGAGVAVLAVLGIVFAVGTMAYTGILLGTSKGIPFWRSGVVPVIFVISAIVTGHFTIMIGVVLFGNPATVIASLPIMAAEAAGLVVLEVLAILFFLQAAYKEPDARESAARILRNRLFVFGYFVLGLGAPLVLMVIVYVALQNGGAPPLLWVTTLGALLGLAGGLILRWAVLVCGALPTLNMAGFQFRRIPKPKDPKPSVGLMPPS